MGKTPILGQLIKWGLGMMGNTDRRSAVAVGLLLGWGLVSSGCTFPGANARQIEIFAEPLKQEGSPEEDNSITIVFASLVSPEESFYKYKQLVNYVGRQLGAPVKVAHRQTYKEANELLRTGEADFGFICSLSYVLGRQEGIVHGVAAPVVNESNLYRCYIITRLDTGKTSLEDLVDRSFAFTDPLSYTGRIAALYALQEKTGCDESCFAEIIYTYSHDSSVRAVCRGLVDAAAVDSIVFEELCRSRPELLADLVVIYEGPLAGMPPIVASKLADTEMVDRFTQALLEINANNEGDAIMRDLGYDRFDVPQEQDYEVVLEAAEAIGGLSLDLVSVEQ